MFHESPDKVQNAKCKAQNYGVLRTECKNGTSKSPSPTKCIEYRFAKTKTLKNWMQKLHNQGRTKYVQKPFSPSEDVSCILRDMVNEQNSGRKPFLRRVRCTKHIEHKFAKTKIEKNWMQKAFSPMPRCIYILRA